MTSTLPEIIDAEYAAAPVSGPEDIYDPMIKSTVEALVLVHEKKPAPINVSPYTPSAPPQNEDPRGLIRRTWDAMYTSVLLPSKQKKVARKREQQRQTAYAQRLYQWAEENKDGVVRSLQQLRAAHDGISTFVQETDYGIRNLQEGLKKAEARAVETADYIRRLDSKISSADYKSQLESSIGAESAEKTIEKYRAEKESCAREMAQLGEIKTYVDLLVSEFSGDAVASQQSLALIAQVMTETVPLRLRLETTLRRYQGLTAHEIDASQATDFLREMRGVVGDLDKGVRQVHSAWTAQAQIFVATSDLPYEPALPDVPLLDAPKEHEK